MYFTCLGQCSLIVVSYSIDFLLFVEFICPPKLCGLFFVSNLVHFCLRECSLCVVLDCS